MDQAELLDLLMRSQQIALDVGSDELERGARRCDDEIFALKYIEIPTSREMHDALQEFEITRQLQSCPTIITIIDHEA
jgi:hypothetical protein